MDPLIRHHTNSWPWHLTWITRGFHRTFATGVACKQGALTLPDPLFWGLAYAPIIGTNFPELVVSFLDFLPWITLSALLDFVTNWLSSFVLPNIRYMAFRRWRDSPPDSWSRPIVLIDEGNLSKIGLVFRTWIFEHPSVFLSLIWHNFILSYCVPVHVSHHSRN